MCLDDVPQISEIDRECFPDHWPVLSFRSELLSNPLSHYLVVLENGAAIAGPEDRGEDSGATHGTRLSQRLRRMLFADKQPQPTATERVLGMVGFWVMAGEAHISTIGVRQSHRRQGLGEMLLISAIELAQVLDATVMTLEVRASNMPARTLYRKYGFVEAGLRKRYYSDKEDAVIMTTDTITAAPFQSRLRRLKEVHVSAWDPAARHLT